MKTVSFGLSNQLATHIEQNSKHLGYEDASEYVSDVLRIQREREQTTLKELLLEGLNSGEPIPATPAFWAELRTETDTLLAKHEQSLDKASAA